MHIAWKELMASLQIRDLPGPLHQMLQLRARQHHRSLNQQALSDLHWHVVVIPASGGARR
jgi:hypothetical protein